MLPPWREEAIAQTHDRKAFDCGEITLNDYLVRFARQSHEAGGAKTFVAVAIAAPTQVLGYYSLSPASIDYARTPEIVRRRLGRYEVPVYRLGRLAIDRRLQRQGLGGQLLIAAGARCLRVATDVGGVALMIDAKNDAVARWYAGFGALPLLDTSLTLLLPLSAIAALLAKG